MRPENGLGARRILHAGGGRCRARRMKGEVNAPALILPPRSSPCSFSDSVKCGTKFRNETPSREEPRRTFYGILVLSHTGGLLCVGRRGGSVSGLSLAAEGGKDEGVRSIILEPALQERVPYDVDAVFHAHLLHRARLIHLDGLDADVEAGGYLLVRVAPGEEA